MEQLRQERDDALAMADIYRIAFDDQLSSNRGLIRQIAELCKEMDNQSSGCHEKFRSSIARLLGKGKSLPGASDETTSHIIVMKELILIKVSNFFICWPFLTAIPGVTIFRIL